MSALSLFKHLIFGIAISLLTTAFPFTASANDSAGKSLEQGFRGIPWEAKVSLLKKKGFNLVEKEEGWDSHGFITVYNFDAELSPFVQGAYSTNTRAIYKFRKNLNLDEMRKITSKIHYYENPDENLSLGENLKFEKIHYIVNDGKLVGVCLHVDKNKSGYEWRENFTSIFPNKKFSSFNNGVGKPYSVAKISKYIKVAYHDYGFVILQMPKKIQDAIDDYRQELEQEKKKKDAMTGGTF